MEKTESIAITKIFQVNINDNPVFLVANKKIAEELCKIMNNRNEALESLREKGIEYVQTSLSTTDKRVWTYEERTIWQSVDEIIQNCPHYIEPEVN